MICVLVTGCGGRQDDQPGDAGSGGSDANSGVSGPSAVSGGRPHNELCSLSATCHDGAISGVFGNYCQPLRATCELGCRQAQYVHQYLGAEHDFDFALASQVAHAGLCNEGEGGAGGESEGGAGGAPALGEGGAGGGSPE